MATLNSSVSKNHILCPSARCEEGAILLGAVHDDGLVRLLDTRIEITAEQVEQANQKGKPETYLRFANKCVESGCKQWKNNRCGIVDEVRETLSTKDLSTTPQKCAIRESCRWFSQDGLDACRLCPLVLTE